MHKVITECPPLWSLNTLLVVGKFWRFAKYRLAEMLQEGSKT